MCNMSNTRIFHAHKIITTLTHQPLQQRCHKWTYVYRMTRLDSTCLGAEQTTQCNSGSKTDYTKAMSRLLWKMKRVRATVGLTTHENIAQSCKFYQLHTVEPHSLKVTEDVNTIPSWQECCLWRTKVTMKVYGKYCWFICPMWNLHMRVPLHYKI